MGTQDMDLVARLGASIDALGGKWMGRPVMAAGAALGFEGYPWPFYMVGRGGVLGDVDPAELADVMRFPSPSLVASAWREGRAVLEPAEGVERFIACGYDWSATDLPGDLDRPSDLLVSLAHGVDVGAAPLAAGWREVALPAAASERVIWAINVLREQRGGIHVACADEAGLDPVEAIMATEGEFMANMYGWEPPFPDVDTARAHKAPVETETNRRVGATYELADAELSELADALDALVES